MIAIRPIRMSRAGLVWVRQPRSYIKTKGPQKALGGTSDAFGLEELKIACGYQQIDQVGTLNDSSLKDDSSLIYICVCVFIYRRLNKTQNILFLKD